MTAMTPEERRVMIARFCVEALRAKLQGCDESLESLAASLGANWHVTEAEVRDVLDMPMRSLLGEGDVKPPLT